MRAAASGPAKSPANPATTIASSSTAPTRGPTPARAGSPRACAGPRASWTRAPSRSLPGPTSPSTSSSSTSCTSARSRREGTFDGVVPRLAGLRELGVTAIELMPRGDLPGRTAAGATTGCTPSRRTRPTAARRAWRAWSTPPTARASASCSTSSTTTSAPATRRCARSGRTSPTASARRRGARRSTTRRPGVREWAIQNAELWVRDYGIDGLRLDAVHAVRDDSDRHVLAELADRVRAANPGALVISEMGPPDFRPLREWDHDAMWLDSLHHALHVALTGRAGRLLRGLRRLDGEHRRRAAPAGGRRASSRAPRTTTRSATARSATGCRDAKRRVAAAVVLFSPFTPLLFQGEEYGESAPVPVLHRPHRPGHRRRHPAGPAARVRPLRRLLRRGARPAGRGGVRALEADAAASRRSCTRACCGCGASCRASWRSTCDEEARTLDCSGAAARRCARTSRTRPSSSTREALARASRSRSARAGTATAPTSRSSPSTPTKVELCLFDERGPRDALRADRAHGLQLARLPRRHRPRPALRLSASTARGRPSRATASTRRSS